MVSQWSNCYGPWLRPQNGSGNEDDSPRSFSVAHDHSLACFPDSRLSKETRLVIAGFYAFLSSPTEYCYDILRATPAELFNKIWIGTEIRFETFSEARLKFPSPLWPRKPLCLVIGYADRFSWALKAFADHDIPLTRAGLVPATPLFSPKHSSNFVLCVCSQPL